MERHHLEIFKVVAEKKSFSQASEVLHISQPAISQQINALEEHLGVRLFDRTTRKVSLTEEGKLLYQYAVKICALFADAERSLSEYSEVVKGTLAIGASLTIGETLLPKVIGDFKELYPQVHITVNVINTEQIIRAVLEQSLEIGLVEGPVNNAELTVQPFMDDELFVVVNPDHPLATQRSVSLDQLTCFPFVLREKGSGTRKIMEEALEAAGLNPKRLPVALELGSTEAVKSAVEANLGVSILSRRSVQKELKLNTLKLLSIDNLRITRKFYVVTNPKRHPTPAFERFLSFIRDEKFKD
ncbi:selenium metabolism-associated LysR family transcriptional regulator [Calderihabitans maritimus]|uniref:selenium metabolism-associated LysR family transcriptional regulator n=1 Tax=Calderihabitans maritimus TaxID=1246530 RepID=UPI000B5008B0|nr:selenium metabolism-associated LysR family transcriptional regulator [Calderihabitans maritimus]